jgi:hypothetical protein
MTNEEHRKQYDCIDFTALNHKVITSMMDIVQLPSPDESFTLFCKVKERFTEDEMAFLVCTHVAEKFRDILQKMATSGKMNDTPLTAEGFERFFNNMKK